MIAPTVLLAKRPSNPEDPLHAETLAGHTESVLECAYALTEMLGQDLQRSLGCSALDIDCWKRAVIIGCWMHDWGKAGDHFQKMLRNPSIKQGVRHETLTLAIAGELETWLEPLWKDTPPWTKSAALLGASGHHLKFPDPYEKDRSGTSATAFLGHEDFRLVLNMGTFQLGLNHVPALKNMTFCLLRKGNLRTTLRSMRRLLALEFNDLEKRLIAATKACIMAADLAGSALPDKVEDANDWIRQKLGRTLTNHQLKGIVSTKLRGQKPHDFQRVVSETSSMTTLVEAGCGSGKTAAAYLWASRHSDGKRLFFCYPTTGTASEGFAGYLRDPDFDAVLIHSRAHVDYRLLENMPDPTHEESDLRAARLEALETWPIPAVVCTAHTVLGIMENVRRGLYAWPSMTKSAVVFDEVHAFSDRLFTYLLRFLQTFPGAPVLLMTATLPPWRRRALEASCRDRGGMETILGPRKREQAKRYRLCKAERKNIWDEVESCLRGGGKVLWISNTVARAMETLNEAQGMGLDVQPYHSRYRYKDRLQRQRAVVDGFLPDKPAMLAVTTQVAEMSLDLSADLLVSEWAPVPSMIQRLGRLNRFGEEPERLGTALLFEPENILPYDPTDLHGLEQWLSLVADSSPKSQAELAEAFVVALSASDETVEAVTYCEWLDGLWSSLKDVRAIEEAGHTVEVILESDLGAGPTAELAIPMPIPRGLDFRSWKREGRYLVAPQGTIAYDDFKGAQWNKNTV